MTMEHAYKKVRECVPFIMSTLYWSIKHSMQTNKGLDFPSTLIGVYRIKPILNREIFSLKIYFT